MPALRIHSLWARESRGLAWLAASVGLTFVLGLALQFVAVRHLSGGQYSTFVFALGLGNVAAAIAGAIQPVVAARILRGDSGGALPLTARSLLVLAATATGVAAAILAPGVGFVTALLAIGQVPLHAAVAIGLGKLQGRRRYPAMALAYGCFAVARLGAVAVAFAIGNAGGTAFVLALPAGLATTILLLVALGAYSWDDLRPANEPLPLVASYLLWAAFSWLLNADAVFARLALPASQAGPYALAVTLGRQSIYAVIPIAFVLLPATQSAPADSQRGRFIAILVIAALLLAGSAIVLGVAPNEVARLLTGRADEEYAAVLRGYAVIGPLGALATLELTFLFALGAAPRAAAVAFTAVIALPLLAFASSDRWLILAQMTVLALLSAWLTAIGLRATRLFAPARGEEQPATGA